MLPSIVSTLNQRSKLRKRNDLRSEKLAYLRETSPDVFSDERFENISDSIQSKFAVGSTLALFRAFAGSVSTSNSLYFCEMLLYIGPVYV